MANILVVDDEIGIRELLSEILSDEGFSVSTAENAESARQQILQNDLDLILLDIWMPDMDGVSLLKELGSKRLLTCPVVMMSGHGTIETAVEATKFGALAFLEKPISTKKLLQAVRHALEVHNRIKTFAKTQPAEPEEPKPEEPEEVQEPEAPTPNELPCYAIPGTEIMVDFNKSLREVREAVERGYLLCLMHHEGCQMTRVAKHAGLERTHLYRKLKSLNLEIPRGDANSGNDHDGHATPTQSDVEAP